MLQHCNVSYNKSGLATNKLLRFHSQSTGDSTRNTVLLLYITIADLQDL